MKFCSFAAKYSKYYENTICKAVQLQAQGDRPADGQDGLQRRNGQGAVPDRRPRRQVLHRRRTGAASHGNHGST